MSLPCVSLCTLSIFALKLVSLAWGCIARKLHQNKKEEKLKRLVLMIQWMQWQEKERGEKIADVVRRARVPTLCPHADTLL